MTQDGRIIIGKMEGHDAMGGVILTSCFERIYSLDAEMEEVPLGVYVVRGDAM